MHRQIARNPNVPSPAAPPSHASDDAHETVEPVATPQITDERGATKTLAPSQWLFVRGYAVTSYASQGKTADTVIIADAGERAATNRQQWYVSISRARKRIVVLTPDRTALRENIQCGGERDSTSGEQRQHVRAERELIAWRERQRFFRELAIRRTRMERQQEDQGVRQRL